MTGCDHLGKQPAVAFSRAFSLVAKAGSARCVAHFANVRFSEVDGRHWVTSAIGQEPLHGQVSESGRSRALSLRRVSATRDVLDTRCSKVQTHAGLAFRDERMIGAGVFGDHELLKRSAVALE